MFSIILAGIFTIGIIIFIHELGHYLAARAVGIHVHRFSLGFGPILFRWHAFSTEWALSLLPFGGYVKMAGMADAPMEGEEVDDEALLPPEKLFRNKSVGKRLLAIVAGPLANLILALLLSIATLHYQGEQIIPDTLLSGPTAGSPAAEAGIVAGDRIVAWDGVAVDNWNQLFVLINDSDESTFNFTTERDGELRDISLNLVDGNGDPVLSGLGYTLDCRVGKVLKDGPADQVGLRHGDRILNVNGKEVTFFSEISEIINSIPEEEVHLVWEREGELLEGTVMVQAADVPDPEEEGRLMKAGRIFYEPYRDWRPYKFSESISLGSQQVFLWSKVTLSWIGKMIAGQGNKDSVGGPITIFRAAGEMARWGFNRLLTFIAFFSTQLFLLNLLPIPVLDGGHIVFLTLEGAGVPMSETWRIRLTTVGMVLILGLMAWIVVLDIVKLF
ncbi:MAG: RIP metalloprotease RseP [bacterium]|nr:RIP metalloprotease RseP [bacterium]